MSDQEQPEQEVPAEATEATEVQETDRQDAEASAQPDAAQAEKEEAAASDEQEQKHRKRGAEKRIAELVREREEAKREAERYKRMAEGRSELPDPNDFEGGEYDPRYIAAVAKAEIQQDLRNQDFERQQAIEAELKQQRHAEFQDQLAEAKSRYEDFEAVAFNPSLPITDAMVEIIAESDKAGDLAYYLGKNPEVTARIARLSPLAAAREIGRIETTLTPPKKVTNAPDPIKPIQGQSEGGAIDPSKMDMTQWMEWRRNQLNTAR